MAKSKARYGIMYDIVSTFIDKPSHMLDTVLTAIGLERADLPAEEIAILREYFKCLITIAR